MCLSPSLQTVQRPVGGTQLLGDISTGVFRPFLPAQFRQAAIRSLHNVHHPGVRATCRLVSAVFCWPHMKKETTAAARSCLGCQRGKTHHHVRLQPEHIPVPQRRFAHLHVDLVGPLPQSAGMTYLFTMVDRTTRWPEVVPLSSTTTAYCAHALLTGWIQRFGVPSTITSDRGPQFTSAVWAALCSLLSINRSTTTAYHPQSNSIVERFHRRLKDALRARAAGADWMKHLSLVLLGVRRLSAQLGGMAPTSHQPTPFTVLSHSCQDNFLTRQRIHRHLSLLIFKVCWPAGHLPVLPTTQRLRQPPFLRTCSWQDMPW
jgi:hypothetical protein